jgi:hypothetical protein
MNARVETQTLPQKAPPAPPAAASLIPQINEAHRASLAADNDAMHHAMHCGELLLKAQETVEGSGGKWTAWRDKHCEFDTRTANVYMQLARGKDTITKAEKEIQQRAANSADADDDTPPPKPLSIRGALALLPKAPPRGRTKTPKTPTQAKPAALDVALDGVAPDEVFTALRDAFDRDELTTLANLLANFLTQPSHER